MSDDSRSLWPLRIVILLHATVGGILGAGFIGPVRHDIQTEFNLSVGVFGSWLAGLALLGALIGFSLMPLLRRWQPYSVVLAGLVLSTAAMATLALSTSLGLMATAWLIISTCAVAGSHMNTLIRDCFQDRSRLGINLMHGVNAIGKVLGPILVGIILVYTLPWRWALGIIALSQVLIALGLLNQRKTAYQLTGNSSSVVNNNITSNNSATPTIRSINHSWFWRATLPFALIAGSEAGFVSIINTYLISEHQLTQTTATGLLTIHLLGLVAGRLVVTWLPVGISNRSIMIACCLPGLICLSLPFASGAISLAIMLFIAGLPFSATYATFYDSAASHPQQDRHALAFGSGLFTACGIYAAIALASIATEWHPTAGMLVGPLMILSFCGWVCVSKFVNVDQLEPQSAPSSELPDHDCVAT